MLKIKPEIRILGFDDGAFKPHTRGRVPVIGVVFRGGKFLDGALRIDVRVDGMDATRKIAKLIKSSRHKQQLKVIMFDGITVGGFNIIDIKKLHEEINLPIIVINRKIPDLKKVRAALKNFKDYKKRWRMIMNAGEIKSCAIKDFKRVYFQVIGLDDDKTREIIRMSTTHSYIPEPLRVAHLFAEAVTKGESSGRA